ncbi:unnamed protein product [Urochloa decumbens]|uniref:Uncharacterized protein n=1 Tax=Urochloa decumbens TaxID=240449 RepID=A0ABC9FUK6_9POAL
MEGGKKKQVAVVVMLLLLSMTASFHGAAARLQGVGVGNGEHGHRGRVAVPETVPTMATRKTAGHSDCTSDHGQGKTGPCAKN